MISLFSARLDCGPRVVRSLAWFVRRALILPVPAPRGRCARLLARFPSTCKKRWEKVVGSKPSSAKVANGTRYSETRW
jgi:hypothetical protein